MNKEIEEAILNKDEIDCCKEELKKYIEFMESAGDNAGWARGLKWYIDKLEKQLADSTPNSVIKETKKDLEKQYKEELGKNSIKAFILKCQLEILEKILKI